MGTSKGTSVAVHTEPPTLPRDLRECTPAQHIAVVRYLTGKGYAELRRMQALIVAQIGMAHRQEQRDALVQLRIREMHIQQAIMATLDN